MYPITLAKVRKETSVTIPAGGYVIVVQPTKPFGEHQALRNQLAAKHPVNDEYSEVIIGQIHATSSIVKFLTTDEKKAQDKRMADYNTSLEMASDKADERQEKINDAKKKAAADEHAKRLAEVNKQNDAIRNRNVEATPAAKSVIPPRKDTVETTK